MKNIFCSTYQVLCPVALSTTLACAPAKNVQTDAETLAKAATVQNYTEYTICSPDGVANVRDANLSQILFTLKNGERVTTAQQSKTNNKGTLYREIYAKNTQRKGWVAASLLCPLSAQPLSIEEKFQAAGLVAVDPSIEVQLAYASTNNMFKTNFYGSLKKCYLHPDIAKKLNQAQRLLKTWVGEGATLIVYDCARPFSVQKAMWEKLPDARYVANPAARGSKHNYGVAVDVTIRNAQGKILDMGTAFDEFSSRSEWGASGLTAAQQQNRALLLKVMREAGFFAYTKEWWHFNGVSELDKKRYPLLDF